MDQRRDLGLEPDQLEEDLPPAPDTPVIVKGGVIQVKGPVIG